MTLRIYSTNFSVASVEIIFIHRGWLWVWKTVKSHLEQTPAKMWLIKLGKNQFRCFSLPPFLPNSHSFEELSGDKSKSVGHSILLPLYRISQRLQLYTIIPLHYLMVEGEICIKNALCQINKWTVNHLTILPSTFSGISKTL